MCSATMAYATTLGNQQRNDALFGWNEIRLAIEAGQLLQVDFHRPDVQWTALVIVTHIEDPPWEALSARIEVLDHILGQHDRQETGSCIAEMHCLCSGIKTQSRSGFYAGRLRCEEESKAE